MSCALAPVRSRRFIVAASLLLLTAVMLTVLAPAVVLPSWSGQAGAITPAGCPVSTAYLAQGRPTTLYREQFGARAVTFEQVGVRSTLTYNAMGFNPGDGFLYAVSPTGAAHPNEIIRIDPSSGIATPIGVTQPPLAVSSINAAAFDPSGGFYVMSSAAPTLYRIDVDTLSATSIALSRTPGSADVAYAYGYLWGFTGATAPKSNVVRIDPQSGRVDFFPLPAVPPAGVFGSVIDYGNGNLAFGSNDGGLYEVAIADPKADRPSFTVVASQSSPQTDNNDGASCISAPTDLQVSATGPSTVAPLARAEWQLSVTNRGPAPSSGFALSASVPAGYTAVSAGAGCDIAAPAVTCTGGALAVGDSVIIRLSARAPSAPRCQSIGAHVLGNEAEPPDPAATDNDARFQTCVVQATVTDTASDSIVQPGDELSDLVTISGLTGQPATVTWTLYGPLRPAAQGCDGLGWTGAAIVAAATMAIVGDGRYPTAPAHLPQPGCYSYATEVSAPSGGFASMAGEPGATALVPAGAISAELTVDTAPPMYGHSLTYRMTVANTAAAVASDLKLLLVLPPGLDLVGATGPKVVTGRVLRWTVGSLAPGVSIELTAVVTPRLRATAEVLTSSFSVTNPPGFAPVALGTPCQQDPSRSCATTRVPAPAGSPQVVASHTVAVQVALARTDGRPAEYVRGQLVPWQLRVSNNGPDALTHISIVDAAVPACVLPVARLATHTTAVISCYTVAAQSITHTATVRIGDGRTIRTIQVSQRIDVGSGLAATGVRTPTQLLAGGVLVGLGTALLLAARRRSVR